MRYNINLLLAIYEADGMGAIRASERNELLAIYESEYNHHVSEHERDILFSILEMKTAREYREKQFKRRFKFKPDRGDPSKGTIMIDGEEFHVDIGNSDKVVFRDNGYICRMDRKSANVTIGGDIILDFKAILKLKNRDRMDALVYHEVGHNKFQGVKISPKNCKVVTNSDDSLSNVVIDEIVKAHQRERESHPRTDSEKAADKYYLECLHKYLTDKLKNSNVVHNKSKLREEAIKYLKQFERDGHTNIKEFEADRYSANKVGEKALRHGMREYAKKTRDTVIKKIPNEAVGKFNDDSSRDMSIRSKMLSDKNVSKYKDIYK